LVHSAADHINHVLIGFEASITTIKLESLSRGTRSDIGIDSDELSTIVALASDHQLWRVVDGSVVVCDKTVRDTGNEVSDTVDLLDPLVERRLGIVSGEPDCFAIQRSLTTIEMLLLTLVDDWNTVLKDSKSNSILCKNNVRLEARKAYNVVVFHE